MVNVIYILGVLAVAMWAYIFGSLSVAVAQSETLPSVYREYNHIQIYEDGSYTGQTAGGLEVTGCIKGGLCNDQL